MSGSHPESTDWTRASQDSTRRSARLRSRQAAGPAASNNHDTPGTNRSTLLPQRLREAEMRRRYTMHGNAFVVESDASAASYTTEETDDRRVRNHATPLVSSLRPPRRSVAQFQSNARKESLAAGSANNNTATTATTTTMTQPTVKHQTSGDHIPRSHDPNAPQPPGLSSLPPVPRAGTQHPFSGEPFYPHKSQGLNNSAVAASEPTARRKTTGSHPSTVLPIPSNKFQPYYPFVPSTGIESQQQEIFKDHDQYLKTDAPIKSSPYDFEAGDENFDPVVNSDNRKTFNHDSMNNDMDGEDDKDAVVHDDNGGGENRSDSADADQKNASQSSNERSPLAASSHRHGEEDRLPSKRRENLVNALRQSLEQLLGSGARSAPHVPPAWVSDDIDVEDDDGNVPHSGAAPWSRPLNAQALHEPAISYVDPAADDDEIVPDIDDDNDHTQAIRSHQISNHRIRTRTSFIPADPYDELPRDRRATSTLQFMSRLQAAALSLVTRATIQSRKAVSVIQNARQMGNHRNFSVLLLLSLVALSFVHCRYMAGQLGPRATQCTASNLGRMRGKFAQRWQVGTAAILSYSASPSYLKFHFKGPKIRVGRALFSRLSLPAVLQYHGLSNTLPSWQHVSERVRSWTVSLSSLVTPVLEYLRQFDPMPSVVFVASKFVMLVQTLLEGSMSILAKLSTKFRQADSPVQDTAVMSGRVSQSAAYWTNINSFIEVYAADKGAPPDYALLSVGAKVVSSTPSMTRLYIRFLRNYVVALFPASNVAYLPTLPNPPSIAFTPDIAPGNCWAFPGSQGSVTVRLARPISPAAITVEHTPRSSVFSVASAPREFAVYILPLLVSESDPDEGRLGIPAGRFMYDISHGAGHLQTFRLADGLPTARAVRIEIESNHGSRTHTCLYRIRVHGEPATGAARFGSDAQAA